MPFFFLRMRHAAFGIRSVCVFDLRSSFSDLTCTLHCDDILPSPLMFVSLCHAMAVLGLNPSLYMHTYRSSTVGTPSTSSSGISRARFACLLTNHTQQLNNTLAKSRTPSSIYDLGPAMRTSTDQRSRFWACINYPI